MNPITASERRGILWVAIVALAVTGIGAALSYFSGPAPAPEEFAEVETVVSGDTVNSSGSKKPTKSKKQSSSKKKQKKIYPQRSPLDEEVGISFLRFLIKL